VNPNIKVDTLDIADRLDVEILATFWIAGSEVVREFAQTSAQITQLNPNLFLPATH
jgi:predicted metalloprotease with PDZ domain